MRPESLGTLLEDSFNLLGIRHQAIVDLPRRRQLVVDPLKQQLFGLTPGNAIGESLSHLSTLCLVSKRTPHLKHRRAIGVFRFAGLQQVSFDFVDGFLQLLWCTKKRDGIAVTLTHLASIQTLQDRDMIIDHRLGQGECIAVVMVKALGNISRHLNVLDLIATHRHLVRIKNQNIGGHQYGVREQSHGDPKVRILAGFLIGLHSGFVSVRPIHQAFCC